MLYDTTVPAVPTGLLAQATYPNVNVLWQADASPSVAQYELKAAQGAGCHDLGRNHALQGAGDPVPAWRLHGGRYLDLLGCRHQAGPAMKAPFRPASPSIRRLATTRAASSPIPISDSQLVTALQQQVALIPLITAPSTTSGSVAQVAQLAAQSVGDMALNADNNVKTAIDAAATGVLWLSGQLSKLSSAFQSGRLRHQPDLGRAGL